MTLGDIFPGNLGRLMLSAVVLRLRRPELMRMSMETPLDARLEAELREALMAVREGR